MPASIDALTMASPSGERTGFDTCSGPPLPWNSSRAALLVFGLFEKRQHRIPVPALAAALTPAVVIGRGAAHVDHAVDRAGAAQDLAARLVESAAVELLFGLGLEHPVHLRIGEGLGVAERDVNPRVGVASARFEQQHAVFSRLAEPPGHRAARRARPGHDEIIGFFRCRHHSVPDISRGTIAKLAASVKHATRVA